MENIFIDVQGHSYHMEKCKLTFIWFGYNKMYHPTNCLIFGFLFSPSLTFILSNSIKGRTILLGIWTILDTKDVTS